tara:strand:- start:425 stop:1225 length:801 start_codon:yes stop_codon:yes gene_type:complete
MADEEAPMMEEMMMEEEKPEEMMMEEEKPEEMMMEEEEEDELNKRLGDGGFMCCCCLCECTNEKTKDLSCCCFFPIRCGVLFIGIFILCLTLFVFLEIFYQLLNDDIHWWFVLVGVVLAATLVVSSAFIIVFFTKDDESSRGKLFTACLLVIVGVATEAVWAACYFVFLYKKDTVVTGNDGVGFIKATRKQEVVVTLYIASCICALFAYFICVINQYVDALKEPEEEMMMMMEEEKKEDDMMMEEKPKEDDMMEEMMEPMEDPPME